MIGAASKADLSSSAERNTRVGSVCCIAFTKKTLGPRQEEPSVSNRVASVDVA